MGLKPRKSQAPVAVASDLSPVYPKLSELGEIYTKARPPNFHRVLLEIAQEVAASDTIKAKKYAQISDKSTWVYKVLSGTAGLQQVASTLTGMVPKVGGLVKLFSHLGYTDPDDYLILAGKFLSKLITDPTLFRKPRSWFTPSQSMNSQGGKYWSNPLTNLVESVWYSYGQDPQRSLDLLTHTTALVHEGNLVETRFDGSKVVWDFTVLAKIEQFCAQRKKSVIGVLRYLTEKFRLKKQWIDGQQFAKHPTYSQLFSDLCFDTETITRLPDADQEWKVDLALHFGIPGMPKIPNELLFGLDLRSTAMLDKELIAIAKNGDRVYKDKTGTVHSEGHPTSRIQQVVNWGKAIQIWVNEGNWEELRSAWDSPPERCPWVWYEKWGNKLYRDDGTAIHPDAKLRPPVEWLEMLNAKKTG
jgi:hypothetical protein